MVEVQKMSDAVLLQCELEIMDIDHQLRNWREELEQAEYAWLLDEIIDGVNDAFDGDEEFMTEPRTKIVPLVKYEAGIRTVIGEAEVDLDTGTFFATVTRDVEELITMPRGSYSVGFDQREQALRVKPEPAFPKISLPNVEREIKGLVRGPKSICSSCEGTDGHHYVHCTLYR